MGMMNLEKTLTVLLYVVIAIIVLHFAPGVVETIFKIGRELGHAVGNVLWS